MITTTKRQQYMVKVIMIPLMITVENDNDSIHVAAEVTVKSMILTRRGEMVIQMIVTVTINKENNSGGGGSSTTSRM